MTPPFRADDTPHATINVNDQPDPLSAPNTLLMSDDEERQHSGTLQIPSDDAPATEGRRDGERWEGTSRALLSLGQQGMTSQSLPAEVDFDADISNMSDTYSDIRPKAMT